MSIKRNKYVNIINIISIQIFHFLIINFINNIFFYSFNMISCKINYRLIFTFGLLLKRFGLGFVKLEKMEIILILILKQTAFF